MGNSTACESPSPAVPLRRVFMAQAVGVAAMLPVCGGNGVARAAGVVDGATSSGPSGQAAAPASAQRATAGYTLLGPEEASFVETLVNVMCPADALTPNGTDCGLAIYIDRQLAGDFGKGGRLYSQGPWITGVPQQGYQLPMKPAEFFKAGIAGARRAVQARYGMPFERLSPVDADGFLMDVAAGKVGDIRPSLADWFSQLVYPLFQQACFADPIYGGNRDKVFWKLIGYPGLPAFHAQDMVRYRGKPFPGAQQPRSIQDFS
jgi:gluconate 2-dehydrogenase gamma chain